MRWLIRVDSSVRVGTGHVARCLTLAKRARARGVTVEFLCCDLPGALIAEIALEGFLVHILSASETDDAEQTQAIASTESVDWLVVDHYEIGAVWENKLRHVVRRILVIDDLANRPHNCDILVDQNYWPDAERRYDGLLPDDCLCLLGPRYLLLRKEFLDARVLLRRSFGQVNRLLVNFGGTDEHNVTSLVLNALAELVISDIAIDVVIGATNPHRREVSKLLSRLPQSRLHVQTSDMATLIAHADLAIGACGSSTWERCYLGLPTIALVLADNQRLAAEQLAHDGVLINLGSVQDITQKDLGIQVGKLIRDTEHRTRMSERSMSILPVEQMDWTDILVKKE